MENLARELQKVILISLSLVSLRFFFPQENKRLRVGKRGLIQVPYFSDQDSRRMASDLLKVWRRPKRR